MQVSPSPLTRVRWVYGVACIVAIVGAVFLMGLGVVGYGSTSGAASAWMIVAGAFVFFLALILLAWMPLVLKIEATLALQVSALRNLNDATTRQIEFLEIIAENTRLSDAARSLAHREQELEALRRAIREDLKSARWEAALTLIDEMERRFGQKDEADHLREELDDARNETLESKLSEAIDIVVAHFQVHDWERAQSELERLHHALPDNAKVFALQDRMKALKEEHKGQLRREWDEAVRRSDTDHAIDVLKEIDQYLSPAEAEALKASARDVFKEKLLQLGVQFRFAVMEKRWQDSVAIGRELIREFPNSRMANEVREVLETLRERARTAGEPESAGTPQVTS